MHNVLAGYNVEKATVDDMFSVISRHVDGIDWPIKTPRDDMMRNDLATCIDKNKRALRFEFAERDVVLSSENNKRKPIFTQYAAFCDFIIVYIVWQKHLVLVITLIEIVTMYFIKDKCIMTLF